MKLLADENVDFSVVTGLRAAGFQVLSVAEMEAGIPDEAVLACANAELALLLTDDKDFGELAFRQGLIHSGVILMRLAGLAAAAKTGLLIGLIKTHENELIGSFTVLSPGLVRIRRKDLPES